MDKFQLPKQIHSMTVNSQRKRANDGRNVQNMWRAFVRLGFRLLYNELAWTYDPVSWLASKGQWRSWQMAAIPYLRGPVVLELAHGPGHILLALQSAGYQVTGLDLSPFMGRHAQRRTGHVRDRIALVRGRAQALPFAKQKFDSALSTFPTEFLTEQATIDSIHRVLKPAGRLVVVPQAQFTGDSAPTRFLEWLYAVTGQRPHVQAGESDKFWNETRERFELAGFVLEVKAVTVKASQVTIVIADKA